MPSLIYTGTGKRRKAHRKPGWREAEAKHRKHLKSLGIDPDAKPKKKEFVPYKPSLNPLYEQSLAHREKYKSASDHTAPSDATAKKPSQKYTGTLITGIATMHKSNAVPVINKKQATEISNMRR